jgi:hypothetical protein
MARRDDSTLHSRVTTILDRLADAGAPKLPASLNADVKTFRGAVGPFVSAAGKADAALSVRDDAHSKIGDADGVLDLSIDDLADACVGAKLGKRTQPFAGFSPYTPSKLKALAYKKEVDAANALVAALLKKNPPKDVVTIATRVQKNAAAVQKLLDGVTGPDASYVKARTARDALLTDAARAIGRFKVRAKSALIDDAGAFDALFGARAAVQAPKAKRTKKPAKTDAAAGDASAPSKKKPA